MQGDAIMAYSTKVFRVEHSESKVGPFISMGYATDHPLHPYLYEIVQQEALPSPLNDGIDLPYAFVCGASSLDTLKKWFWSPSILMDKFLAELKKAGFVLRQYEVHPRHCRSGRSGLQVFFDQYEASLVKELEIESLFERP